MDITRARLAARDYRNARSTVQPDRHGPADKMATEIECLAPGAGIIEPCHDDSEECVHCAFPEHAAVVILLADTPVCREHIWRALTGTLGVRDRHI
jgi:hypothetical protein